MDESLPLSGLCLEACEFDEYFLDLALMLSGT
jgi:hypothetical protein